MVNYVSEEVNKIFSDMSRDYDRVNKACSSGTMIIWRRSAAKASMLKKKSFNALDIGTGTGELVFEICREAARLGKRVDVIGVDFSRDMIEVARRKASRLGVKARFELGDAMHLKYRRNTFDLVTSSLAVKNVDSQKQFAMEAYRVLRKGGRIVVLELIRPRNVLNRAVINAYWGSVIRVGFIGRGGSYKALKASVDRFDSSKLVHELDKAGFRDVRARTLFSGAAVLVTADKS
jgi:demethylmenaquinone methyltransferase/2-methoxy-6-polyprenyl-1,4-benzoquinol methylase